jgi:proteasome lid subunit RPN8/RPN11
VQGGYLVWAGVCGVQQRLVVVGIQSHPGLAQPAVHALPAPAVAVGHKHGHTLRCEI